LINATFLAHFLNGLLMILMPVGLGIFLAQRFHLGWRIWWIGAATFVLSQVGHIPFNAGVSALFKAGILPTPPQAWQLPFNLVFLGLSSGLWEEWSRYAAYRWWAKDARSWRSGLVLGAGHGGAEAIILGVLVLLTFVNMVAAQGMDLTKQVPADQVETARQQIQMYWSLPWYQALVGALERAFTLVFHLSASLLVLQAFLRKQIRWVWLSAGWHALTNAGAVYVAQTWGAYQAEIWVGLIALFSLGIIFWLRKPGLEPATELPPAPEILPETPPVEFLPPEESLENIEKTRYN
jgi:uncharacterized membrane protein YhfC